MQRGFSLDYIEENSLYFSNLRFKNTFSQEKRIFLLYQNSKKNLRYSESNNRVFRLRYSLIRVSHIIFAIKLLLGRVINL